MSAVVKEAAELSKASVNFFTRVGSLCSGILCKSASSRTLVRDDGVVPFVALGSGGSVGSTVVVVVVVAGVAVVADMDDLDSSSLVDFGWYLGDDVADQPTETIVLSW